ncbi:MAG TPA: hypothetical protein VNM91_01590 [Dehalococcoidia bacterium]|nr:hypothetical protein [Dehalococcoidia bacterium]
MFTPEASLRAPDEPGRYLLMVYVAYEGPRDPFAEPKRAAHYACFIEVRP